KEVFLKIVTQRQTDFLFYISSSYINRFREHESFKKYLEVEKIDFEGKSYFQCHRVILDYYKSLIPENYEYYLAPFSIKKNSNIFGLIFGSSHPLALEKFLAAAWKIDKLRGEANYDIDKDRINPATPSLFPEFNTPKKLQVFEEELTNQILQRNLLSNYDVYLFGLTNGFLPKHVNTIIRKLIKQHKINSFKTCSSNVHKLRRYPEKIVVR
ncbi:MAG: hypothetical protein D6730_22170, partial [Bacteroidetes bacterium]